MRKTLKYLWLAMLAIFLAGPGARAGTGLELIIGSATVDVETGEESIDDTGSVYAAAIDNPIGDSGWLTGHVRAERVGSFDEISGGAYCLDVDLLLNLAKSNHLFDLDIGAGLGGIFGDVIEDTQEIAVTDGEEVVTAEVPVMEQNTYLSGNVAARLNIFFSEARDFGVGAEYRYRFPLDKDQPVNSSGVTVVYLRLPLAQ